MREKLITPSQTTWNVLERSRNLAASLTLSTGLSSASDEIRHRCVSALLERGQSEDDCTILKNWERFNEADKFLVKQSDNKIDEACKQLLQRGSLAEQRAVLEAVEDLDVVEATDEVLQFVIFKRHALNGRATSVLMSMCKKWGKASRSQDTTLGFHDKIKRNLLLKRLHKQMVLYHEHRNPQIVDAWLALVHWDDSEQRSLLSDPTMDAYKVMMDRLKNSPDLSVLQLLAGYVGRTTTPKRVSEILAARPEQEIGHAIASLLNDRNWSSIATHLRRLPPLACFQGVNASDETVPKEIEERLWQLVAVSSDNCAQILGGAIKLSRKGTSQGRKSAAKVLRSCRYRDFQTIVPALQTAAAGSGPDQDLGSLMQVAVGWLNSPSTLLKEASKHFFQEFTLENLVEQVRVWPTQMCRSMAEIVKTADPKATHNVSRHLRSPAPRKRIAALQAVEMLDCAHDLIDELLPMLDDPRLDVRVRVIDILSVSRFEPFEAMIPDLLNDVSTDIQDAAERALARMSV